MYCLTLSGASCTETQFSMRKVDEHYIVLLKFGYVRKNVNGGIKLHAFSLLASNSLLNSLFPSTVHNEIKVSDHSHCLSYSSYKLTFYNVSFDV